MMKKIKEEMEEWESALHDYQELLPVESARDKLKSEIPDLEAQIRTAEGAMPAVRNKADEVCTTLLPRASRK